MPNEHQWSKKDSTAAACPSGKVGCVSVGSVASLPRVASVAVRRHPSPILCRLNPSIDLPRVARPSPDTRRL